MDSTTVMPFIQATRNVFDTMLSVSVSCGSPAIIKHETERYDVSGIIGMSGDVNGVVVLRLPSETAEGAVKAFTGMEMSIDSEDFADAIGELANMITGNAKSKFEGRDVSISCPSVVTGRHHQVQFPSDSIRIAIPCESSLGKFVVEVAVRMDAKEGSNSSERAAAA